MFRKDVVLAQEYLGFLLLNLFDLFLTGYIFRHEGQEANPAAIAIMKFGGLAGFAIYKFVLVAVVVLACEGISTKSLKTSKIVITGGIIIYSCLVLYESYIIATNIHKFG